MSLIKNHLDLAKSHLWVVYPRIRKEDNKLHAQIMGVWDPQLVLKPLESTADEAQTIPTIESSGIPDTYFSIRGEVIYQSRETREIFVKIRQSPKKKNEEERYFKIRLVGDLPQKLVGNFWDFDVIRVDNDLTLRSAQFVAALRVKPPRKGGGSRPPDGGSKKPYKKFEEGEPGAPNGLPVPAGIARSDVDKPKPLPVKRSLPPKLDVTEQ
jgi:hypothetical protein